MDQWNRFIWSGTNRSLSLPPVSNPHFPRPGRRAHDRSFPHPLPASLQPVIRDRSRHSLRGRWRRSDLNGTEVGRVRITNNPVYFTNRAALASPEGIAYTLNIPSDRLVMGDNVLAVEVHQHAPSDSDVVFGIGLQASVAAAPFIRSPAEPADRTIAQFGSTVLTVDGTGTPTPRISGITTEILSPGQQVPRCPWKMSATMNRAAIS